MALKRSLLLGPYLSDKLNADRVTAKCLGKLSHCPEASSIQADYDDRRAIRLLTEAYRHDSGHGHQAAFVLCFHFPNRGGHTLSASAENTCSMKHATLLVRAPQR